MCVLVYLHCLIGTDVPLAIFADWDMVFPDDEREANPASFKFFQAAQEWSRTQALADLSDSDSESDEEEAAEEENGGGGGPMDQDDGSEGEGDA